VDYVIGAAMAVRRSLLMEIGLFDEGFFLYYEDADLCRRALAAGHRVVYEPRATAVHVESAVTVKGSFSYYQRFHAGRWRYLIKHSPADMLLDETFPAERAWLPQIDADERRAVSLAYLAVFHTLPDIWRTRGDAPLPEETRTAIERDLSALRELARQHAAVALSLEQVKSAARLKPQPFTSNAPVIGRLIVWLRTTWNNVASRWYVDHLVDQQNTFNHLILDQLAAYETELNDQLALLEEQVVSQEELRRRVQELSAQLTELRRMMATVGPAPPRER
jgi:hypothetical protein